MKSNKTQPNQTVEENMQPDREVAPLVACSVLKHATKYSEILNRMKDAVGAKSDTGFAKLLGLRQSSISSAKKREQIPPTWAIQVAEMTGASLDWLLFGKKCGEEQDNPAEFVEESKPIYNDRRNEGQESSGDVGGYQPTTSTVATKPSIADLLTKTARVLESETVYQTALTSNIEAFYHSVALEERIEASEANTNKMLLEMRKEIQSVRKENQQLRDEMRRDRDQAVAEDTG